VIAGMLVPPGSYRLRVAATDSGGRTGTSDYELAAELRQAGLRRESRGRCERWWE
jgi:hypothetical protein